MWHVLLRVLTSSFLPFPYRCLQPTYHLYSSEKCLFQYYTYQWVFEYYINEGEKLAKWKQTFFSHSKRKSWTSLLPTEARCPPWSLKRQSEIMKISNTCKTFHQQTMIHLCRSTCSTCPYSQPSQRHIFLYMFQCRRLKAEGGVSCTGCRVQFPKSIR